MKVIEDFMIDFIFASSLSKLNSARAGKSLSFYFLRFLGFIGFKFLKVFIQSF